MTQKLLMEEGCAALRRHALRESLKLELEGGCGEAALRCVITPVEPAPR
jgi:hypothetical protein